MISKSLSTSEKFAALYRIAGKLAEFCQSLYPLLVAHADDWGCLPGDVFTVKHLVHPTSPRRLPDFHDGLVALHRAELITWYQVPNDDQEHPDKWVIYIRGWYAHQQLKGHDNGTRKRNFPPPPENASDLEEFAQIRPAAPKSALREEKRTEENLIPTVADPATAEANKAAGAFLKRFCELYSHYRHGAKYLVNRAKDVPNVKRLLSQYDAERLEKLARVLFTTDDDWIANTDRGIGILTVKASWLDDRLAEHEAKHGKIQVA